MLADVGRADIRSFLNEQLLSFLDALDGAIPAPASLALSHHDERFIQQMHAIKADATIDLTCYNAEQAQVSIEAFRGVGHFIQTSTVCTYGHSFPEYPVEETFTPQPVTIYGKNKYAADQLFLDTHVREQFPVTIIKPSTTYSGKSGVLRQLAIEHTWIDRIRKGKPIILSGDGNTLHQFMHADDVARAFSGVLGKEQCIGQIYNVCASGATTWEAFHRTAMKVLGREVPLVYIPMHVLLEIDAQRFVLLKEIFGQHAYYSTRKLKTDVPEFREEISLEDGLRSAFDYMDKHGEVPNSDHEVWEDEIINWYNR